MKFTVTITHKRKIARYGVGKSNRDAISYFHQPQKPIYKVSGKLCLTY